jgi:hypothetical protein
MAQFTVNNAAFTPSTSQDNWALDTNGTTAIGKVKIFSWGGNLNTATSYRTRWYRPSTIGSGTFTALVTQGGNPAATAVVRAGTFATALTPPTEPAGLFEMAWNAFGGGGTIVLPIGGEWLVYGNAATTTAGQIGCRNAAGVDASGSSYSCTWEE